MERVFYNTGVFSQRLTILIITLPLFFMSFTFTNAFGLLLKSDLTKHHIYYSNI